MKITKNLPIYLLSASLLFVGVTSISQAQGATSVSSQIVALQKQVKTLQSEARTTHDFINIIGQRFEDRITALENNQQSSSFKTTTITYAIVGTSSLLFCDPNQIARNVVTYNSPLIVFGLCSTKVLIP